MIITCYIDISIVVPVFDREQAIAIARQILTKELPGTSLVLTVLRVEGAEKVCDGTYECRFSYNTAFGIGEDEEVKSDG